MNKDEKNELLMLMEKCGHFLYHRRGKKRSQGKILKMLLMNGEVTQKELQNYLGIQSGSISEIINKLESSKFILKEKDKEDKRKFKIKITNEGKDFFEENLKDNIEEEEKLFDCLEENEQENLEFILSKLLDTWKSNYDKSLFNHKLDEK